MGALAGEIRAARVPDVRDDRPVARRTIDAALARRARPARHALVGRSAGERSPRRLLIFLPIIGPCACGVLLVGARRADDAADAQTSPPEAANDGGLALIALPLTAVGFASTVAV